MFSIQSKKKNNSEVNCNEEVVKSITKNCTDISRLLNEKNRISAKIQLKLDVMRHAKKPLDTEQISLFSRFMKMTLEHDKKVKEVIHSNMNLGLLEEQLISIVHEQNDVISSLEIVKTEGNHLLSKLF